MFESMETLKLRDFTVNVFVWSVLCYIYQISLTILYTKNACCKYVVAKYIVFILIAH